LNICYFILRKAVWGWKIEELYRVQREVKTTESTSHHVLSISLGITFIVLMMASKDSGSTPSYWSDCQGPFMIIVSKVVVPLVSTSLSGFIFPCSIIPKLNCVIYLCFLVFLFSYIIILMIAVFCFVAVIFRLRTRVSTLLNIKWIFAEHELWNPNTSIYDK